MARQLRVEWAGAMYHVTVRSNGREALFKSDFDRRYLLARLGEAVEAHKVRVYLFCEMANHVHVVLETPRANLGRFMQAVLTGYGVHFNRVHRRHGHVTQGRYGAKLVEGDEYLLKLSRYVHLNPVKIAAMASKPLEERRTYLREYAWSSFRGYVGLGARNEFVDYGAVLAMMGGRKADQARRYQEYVEAGIATDDEEFQGALTRSGRSIGSDRFRERVDEEYRALVEQRPVREDVAFRRAGPVLSAERILAAVASAAKVTPAELRIRRRDSRWRAVASRMLCRYGGLTQRKVADILGVKTGVAVSCQMKKLSRLLESDEALGQAVRKLEQHLDRQLGQRR
jgi:REP element-mobilizing transposase RayT